MNYDEISKRLEQDEHAFFTALAAHNAGYINDSVYDNFNVNSLIGHLSVQRPHLIEKVLPYTGPIKFNLVNVDVKYNLNLYDEEVILKDITSENANFYLEHLNELSDKCKIKLYSVLEAQHVATLQRLRLRVPVMYINNKIKLMYTIYMMNERDYLDYLISLSDPGFIFDNLDRLRNVITEAYILRNVTDINSNSIKALKKYGFTMDKILVFKPEAIEFALDEVNSVGDLILIIKAIQKETSIHILDRLYKEFPEYSNMINDLVRDRINSLMKT